MKKYNLIGISGKRGNLEIWVSCGGPEEKDLFPGTIWDKEKSDIGEFIPEIQREKFDEIFKNGTPPCALVKANGLIGRVYT